ncbi:MAG: helix-turn-helix domain-containing protein [Neomegalonema sp.]|nr:helix-turn-helix domain-containing protein [Neomegalonema sp.]
MTDDALGGAVLHAAASGHDDYFGDEAETLGGRLAAARLAASMTQASLAARLGVGVKVVSAWEHDRSEPRANRLAMLSGLLGVSVTWLLSGAGEGVTPPGEVGAQEVETGPRPLELLSRMSDLGAARAFYADLLGCAVLEGDEDRLSFDLFGHRLTVERSAPAGVAALELRLRPSWREWIALVERLRAANAQFEEEPAILNVGAPSEEGAFVLSAPEGLRVSFRAVAERD